MRFWRSDDHLHHDRIIEFGERPFKDIHHMTEEFVRRHNEHVAPDDEVWWLGDVAMGDRTVSLPIVERFNGVKTLVVGNHDNCWPGGKKTWAEWEKAYEDVGFTILHEEYPGAGIKTKIGSHEVTVSHFPPWTDDRHGNKYAAWMPYDDGGIFAHGHTHQRERIRDDRFIHVGVDAWDYFPASEDELIALIEGAP